MCHSTTFRLKWSVLSSSRERLGSEGREEMAESLSKSFWGADESSVNVLHNRRPRTCLWACRFPLTVHLVTEDHYSYVLRSLQSCPKHGLLLVGLMQTPGPSLFCRLLWIYSGLPRCSEGHQPGGACGKAKHLSPPVFPFLPVSCCPWGQGWVYVGINLLVVCKLRNTKSSLYPVGYFPILGGAERLRHSSMFCNNNGYAFYCAFSCKIKHWAGKCSLWEVFSLASQGKARTGLGVLPGGGCCRLLETTAKRNIETSSWRSSQEQFAL